MEDEVKQLVDLMQDEDISSEDKVILAKRLHNMLRYIPREEFARLTRNVPGFLAWWQQSTTSPGIFSLQELEASDKRGIMPS